MIAGYALPSAAENDPTRLVEVQVKHLVWRTFDAAHVAARRKIVRRVRRVAAK